MTTYGFLATNGNSQVLISSKTKNLHFLGKATFYSTLESSDSVGGLRRWAYRIESQSVPVPFFSVPTADRYAIVRMSVVATNIWEIEIMRSGTSTSIPEVYVFSEINTAMKPSGSWGMQVLNETSGISYDSRLKPLVIKGSDQVIPTYKPHNPELNTSNFAVSNDHDGYCSFNNETGMGRLTPNNANSSYIYNTNCTKPIVNYQSVAQTHVQVDEDHGWTWRNILGFSTRKLYFSHYWGFFRAAVSVQQTGAHSYITCGWTILSKGCFGSNKDINGWAGVIPLGSDTSTGGTSPISNQTLNLRNTPIIIADGTLYD